MTTTMTFKEAPMARSMSTMTPITLLASVVGSGALFGLAVLEMEYCLLVGSGKLMLLGLFSSLEAFS